MDDMRTSIVPALALAILTACASGPEKESSEAPPDRSHRGKSIGIAAGGLGGIAFGLSSAGVLCAIGPLCAVIVIPAAIIGGVLGGTAGSVVDAISDSQAEREKERTDPPRGDTSTPPGG